MKRPENKEKLARDAVKEKRDFFDRYLSNESRNFVKRAHVSASTGIGLIHDAGGIAVWSHPPIPDFKNGEYEELEKFLQELILWGIDGLEVFSASHREDDAEFLYGGQSMIATMNPLHFQAADRASRALLELSPRAPGRAPLRLRA